MIKYSLKCCEKNCNSNEPFDGWFQNSKSYEHQINAGLLSCPYCGSLNIEKNLMSPSIKSSKPKTLTKISKEIKENNYNKNKGSSFDVLTVLRNVKKEIQKNAEFVGENFAREAKDIKSGKSKKRAIYGHANSKEIKELKSRDIDIVSVPWVQDDN